MSLRAVSFGHQSRLSVHVLFHDVWFSRVSQDLFHQFCFQSVVVGKLLVLHGFVPCDCKRVSIVQVAELLDGHPSFVLVDGAFLRRFLILATEPSVASSSCVSHVVRACCFGGCWLLAFPRLLRWFVLHTRVRPSRTIFPVVDTTLPSTAGTSFCSCSSHPTAVGKVSSAASCARVGLDVSRCVRSPPSERAGVLRRVRPTARLHVPPIVRRACPPRTRRKRTRRACVPLAWPRRHDVRGSASDSRGIAFWIVDDTQSNGRMRFAQVRIHGCRRTVRWRSRATHGRNRARRIVAGWVGGRLHSVSASSARHVRVCTRSEFPFATSTCFFHLHLQTHVSSWVRTSLPRAAVVLGGHISLGSSTLLCPPDVYDRVHRREGVGLAPKPSHSKRWDATRRRRRWRTWTWTC